MWERSKTLAKEILLEVFHRTEGLYRSKPDVNLLLEIPILSMYIDTAGMASVVSCTKDFTLPIVGGNEFYSNCHRIYGLTGGCGDDHNSTCIALKEIIRDYGVHEGGVARVAKTLIHEALHHHIRIIPNDPQAIKEHSIIYSVLGDIFGKYNVVDEISLVPQKY